MPEKIITLKQPVTGAIPTERKSTAGATKAVPIQQGQAILPGVTTTGMGMQETTEPVTDQQ